jgi:phosphate transport system permease protein
VPGSLPVLLGDAVTLAETHGPDGRDLADALRGSSARRGRETAIKIGFLLAALTSVLISFFIIETLLAEAISFLSDIDLGELFGFAWAPRRGLFDIRTLLMGSLLVALIAMVVATPLGLGAAVYLSEYASPQTRRTLKPVLEVLASIPSVVLGFFALRFLSPNVVEHLADWIAFPRLAPGDSTAEQLSLSAVVVLLLVIPFTRVVLRTLGESGRRFAGPATVALVLVAAVLFVLSVASGGGNGSEAFNLAAAGFGVGVLIIPLIASVAEDAMRAVPRSLREAAYGLGARPMTVSLQIVFPAAISGIVAALLLAVSRAIGETLVVAVAAGGSGATLYTTDLTEPGTTITAAIASLAFGSDQVAGDDSAFQSLYFLGLLLFVITFLLNILGDVFVRRTRQTY